MIAVAGFFTFIATVGLCTALWGFDREHGSGESIDYVPATAGMALAIPAGMLALVFWVGAFA